MNFDFSLLNKPALYFTGLALTAFAVSTSANALPQDHEGVWRGAFISDPNSECPRPEFPIKVEVLRGEVKFLYGRDWERSVEGEVDLKDTVKAYGESRRGNQFVVEGKFSGNRFDGTFYVGNGRCSGTVEAFRQGGRDGRQAARDRPPRPGPDRARLTEEREAKLKAEAEAKEMQAQIERLKAEQEALKKKAELAELQAQNQQNQVASVPAGTRGVGGSNVQAELATLKKLRDDGLITDDQYQTKQKEVLDKAFGSSGTRTAKAEPAPVPKKKKLNVPADINFGNYHALVIGINNYKHLNKLETAEADAKAMAETLKTKYGFKVNLLLNPTRADIVDTLDDLRSQLKFKDNLLIYYAGHGWLDEKADQGFWLPVDAKPNRRSNWVSNDIITGSLRAMEAKHVMVVADSCYSGRLVRGTKITMGDSDFLKKISRKKARVVITSGGLEPVADGDGSGHSPFTNALLKTLNSNDGVLDGNTLFNTIRRPVMVNADQTPQFSDVRKAGHDGGDFLFVPRN